MNTVEILARLPKEVQEAAKEYKSVFSMNCRMREYTKAMDKKTEINGYCKALQDMGLVNKEERQRISSYLTL